MKRLLRAAGLGLAWLSLVGQASYSNRDIQAMKAHYQPHRSVTHAASLPEDISDLPYQPPTLVPWMLPYEKWDAQLRNYFQRHYHDSSLTFKPSAIIMHYTVVNDANRVWEGFHRGCRMNAGDYGSIFGHPCVQLMINTDGTVYQLLPLDHRCTGAYGVNHKALSIEMVASDEADLLSRSKQVFSSFCLVRYLMRRYDIGLDHVYGHYEVGKGSAVVPEYLDYADSQYPDGYPPSSARTDPGQTYMSWLRSYVAKVGPAP